jgi:hypothetical protein
MKKRLAIMAVAALLGFAGARAGQLTMMDIGGGGGCDNALDFSQACNSANLGVIL